MLSFGSSIFRNTDAVFFVLNDQQGTPLRKAFKTARLTLDDAAAKARERTTDRQKKLAERMQQMTKERKARFEEMDKSGGERTGSKQEIIFYFLSLVFGAGVVVVSEAPGRVRSPARVEGRRKMHLRLRLEPIL